jgi:hypothetical protein
MDVAGHEQKSSSQQQELDCGISICASRRCGTLSASGNPDTAEDSVDQSLDTAGFLLDGREPISNIKNAHATHASRAMTLALAKKAKVAGRRVSRRVAAHTVCTRTSRR